MTHSVSTACIALATLNASSVSARDQSCPGSPPPTIKRTFRILCKIIMRINKVEGESLRTRLTSVCVLGCALSAKSSCDFSVNVLLGDAGWLAGVLGILIILIHTCATHFHETLHYVVIVTKQMVSLELGLYTRKQDC